MNSPSKFDSVHAEIDATLRLVATLPTPEGLEDRVHAKLRAVPRSGRVLSWPMATGAWMRSTAMRSAAAAAIVFVVAGGGWGIYTRVQPSKVIAMPLRDGTPGGFSGAGAMRTPQPFNPPRVKEPAAGPTAAPAAGRVVPMPARKSAASKAAHAPAAKPAAQPVTPPSQ